MFFFLCAAAKLAQLELWQQLCIMDAQCSYTADFFEP